MKNTPIHYIRSLLSLCFSGEKSSPHSSNTLWEMGLVAIGVAASCYFFYPGCIMGDPHFSWTEALNNPTPQYHNWHPPMVAFVWHLLNQLPFSFDPRYADLFMAMNLLYWVGLVLAIRPWIRYKFLWIVFFVYAGFFPPAFGIVSHPIKDSLMCAALLAAYGALLTAERQQSKIAFGFGLFCLFLALGFRHNAVFAVFPLTIWAGFIFCQSKPHYALRKKIAAGIAIFLTLLAIISTANHLLTRQSSYPVQGLYAYDLVGISAITGHVYLPELYNDYQTPYILENFFALKGAKIEGKTTSIENIRQLYVVDSNVSLYWYGPGKGLRFLDQEENITTLRQAWLQAVFEHPLTYLKVRGDLYLSLMGLLPSNVWPYGCMNKNGRDYMPKGFSRYYLSINETWLCKGLAYLAIIASLFAIACLEKPIFPLHIRAIGASGLVYAASYFFIGVGSDFRYLYWLMPVSLIMAINMAFITFTRKIP